MFAETRRGQTQLLRAWGARIEDVVDSNTLREALNQALRA